jgi:nicotinamidase-related amidase
MSPITPDPSKSALLLIDVINDLMFDGGEDLLRHARPMARQLVRLKRYAQAQKMPVIYANDNFGQWHVDFQTLVRHCLQEDKRGREIVQLLQPGEDDYFVLKPKHSAFYQTSLDVLLSNLGVTSLVLTGMAGDICVLFTANDAYMRDFNIIVPGDCVASEDEADNEQVLRLVQRVLKADITPFAKWEISVPGS